MATFKSKKKLQGDVSLIPVIAEKIKAQFESEGYTVQVDSLLSGGADISIAKGSVFKAVLGMKSALKVTLIPQQGTIDFGAGVGIFGQQVIPALIAYFVFWPVLITQIWGLVQQSQLDDKALAIAEEVIHKNTFNTAAGANPSTLNGTETKFCPYDGTSMAADARYCPHCGKEV